MWENVRKIWACLKMSEKYRVLRGGMGRSVLRCGGMSGEMLLRTRH